MKLYPCVMYYKQEKTKPISCDYAAIDHQGKNCIAAQVGIEQQKRRKT